MRAGKFTMQVGTFAMQVGTFAMQASKFAMLGGKFEKLTKTKFFMILYAHFIKQMMDKYISLVSRTGCTHNFGLCLKTTRLRLVVLNHSKVIRAPNSYRPTQSYPSFVY